MLWDINMCLIWWQFAEMQPLYNRCYIWQPESGLAFKHFVCITCRNSNTYEWFLWNVGTMPFYLSKMNASTCNSHIRMSSFRIFIAVPLDATYVSVILLGDNKYKIHWPLNYSSNMRLNWHRDFGKD